MALRAPGGSVAAIDWGGGSAGAGLAYIVACCGLVDTTGAPPGGPGMLGACAIIVRAPSGAVPADIGGAALGGAPGGGSVGAGAMTVRAPAGAGGAPRAMAAATSGGNSVAIWVF